MARQQEEKSTTHWSQEGKDPDYRFTLANERTFLAWIRTSLALLTAAVVLKQLIPPFNIPGLRTGLSAILAAMGLAIAATSYTHWRGYEIAMRRSEPLPRSRLMFVIAALLAIAAAVFAIEIFSSWD